MVNYSKKIIPIILIIGIMLNISLSFNNINKFDKYRDRSDGNSENYLIRSDILYGWKSAEKAVNEGDYYKTVHHA